MSRRAAQGATWTEETRTPGIRKRITVGKKGRRNERYVVKGYDPLTKRMAWVGTYDTESDARRAKREWDEAHEGAGGRHETVASFAGRWTRDFPRPRRSTDKHNGERVGHFARAYGSRRMDSITTDEARAWALAHPGQLNALRAMFNDARRGDERSRVCRNNPFSALGLPTSPGRANDDPPNEAEVLELADLCVDVWGEAYGLTLRCCLLFGFYTLTRPGELWMLEHQHVDIERGLLHVEWTLSGDTWKERPKNGEPRIVVLPPQARDAYLAMPRRTDSPLLFYARTGQRFSKSSFHYVWDPVRKAWATRGEGRDPGLDWYLATKHAGITHMYEVLGLPPEDIALQAAHNDGGQLIRERYGHPSKDLTRARIAAAWRGNVSPLRPVEPGGPAPASDAQADGAA